jgi:hypothetical protein
LYAGSWLRLGCSRLAGNQIGDVGVEALAHALPPSLTMLGLSGTCGLGASVLSLSVWACGALGVACGARCLVRTLCGGIAFEVGQGALGRR